MAKKESTSNGYRYVFETSVAVETTYERPDLSNEAAFFGHYEPTRERVQMLLDYARANDHDPFWRALARRLTTPGCGSPWNAAVAAAEEAGVVWANAPVRALVYGALYEGRIAARQRNPEPLGASVTPKADAAARP